MRIDAHQHFWHYNAEDYAWITDAMAPLKRDFLSGDLKPLLEGIGFDGSIAVQARHSLDETRWLLEMAEANEFVRGVVGWVDLCSPEPGGASSSCRRAASWQASGMRLRTSPTTSSFSGLTFAAASRCLREFGLAYDILIYPRHLRAAASFARRFPRAEVRARSHRQAARLRSAQWSRGTRTFAHWPSWPTCIASCPDGH